MAMRDLIGQSSRAFAAIEGVVTIPERLPSGKVCGLNGADSDLGRVIADPFGVNLVAA